MCTSKEECAFPGKKAHYQGLFSWEIRNTSERSFSKIVWARIEMLSLIETNQTSQILRVKNNDWPLLEPSFVSYNAEDGKSSEDLRIVCVGRFFMKRMIEQFFVATRFKKLAPSDVYWSMQLSFPAFFFKVYLVLDQFSKIGRNRMGTKGWFSFVSLLFLFFFFQHGCDSSTWVISDFNATGPNQISLTRGLQVEVLEHSNATTGFVLVRLISQTPSSSSNMASTALNQGLVPISCLKWPPHKVRTESDHHTHGKWKQMYFIPCHPCIYRL